MRILVVEDEHKIAQSIKQGLLQETYAVDLCFNGLEGLEMGLDNDYDLIILDLMLPDKNGLEICREWRAGNVNAPVLILTAKGQVNDKVLGLDAGADDYLTKPFAFEELLARVRALVRRPLPTTLAVLKIADLSLDPKTKEVNRANKKINLTSREYAILELFLRHKEQLLTKEQIISHVWNYEANILPNTVEVFIANLREKLAKPFRNKPTLIQTVRGFGYKLSEDQ